MKKDNFESEIKKLNKILNKTINAKIVQSDLGLYKTCIVLGTQLYFSREMFTASNGVVPVLEIIKALRDLRNIILDADAQLKKYLEKGTKS